MARLHLALVLCLCTVLGCATSKSFKPPHHTIALPSQELECSPLRSGMSYASEACRAKTCSPGNVEMDGYPGMCCHKDEVAVFSLGYQTCNQIKPTCPDGMEAGIWGCDFKVLSDRVELRMESCKGGNLQDCHRAGAMLYDGDRYITQDLARAQRIFEANCSAGFVESCGQLGAMHTYGEAPQAASIQYGRELLTFACDANDSSACARLAYIYEHWDDDLEKALKAFDRACTFNARSCDKAAKLNKRLYPPAEKSGFKIKQEITQITEAVTKKNTDVCFDMNSVYDCLSAFRKKFKKKGLSQAKLLKKIEGHCHDDRYYDVCEALASKLYFTTPKDESVSERAMRYKVLREAAEVACMEGDQVDSCTILGRVYERGLGVVPDAPKSLAFYESACDGDEFRACHLAGQAYKEMAKTLGDKSLKEKAFSFFEKSCTGRYDTSCFELGQAYYFRYAKSYSEKESNQRSLEIFTYGCHEHAHASSCYFLSGYYRYVSKDQALMEKYMSMGCQYGNSRACLDMLTFTEGDPFELFEKIIQGGQESMRVEQEVKRRDEDQDAADLSPPPTKEERLHTLLKSLDEHIDNCMELEDDRKVCDYVTNRYNIIIKIAYKRYRLACESGDATSCTLRARLNMTGAGELKRKSSKFMPYLERGCELDDPTACALEAKFKFYGYSNTPIDYAAAHKAAQRSCRSSIEQERASAPMCLKALYIAAHTSTDVDQTAALTARACDVDNLTAATLCRERVDRDLEHLSTIYPKAMGSWLKDRCADEDPRSCALHARNIQKLSASQSLDLARQMCDLASDADCSEYGRQLAEKPDTHDEGIALLNTSCHSSDHAGACLTLGDILSAKTFATHQAKGREAFTKGCELGHGPSCARLGSLYSGMGSIPEDASKARAFFKKACNVRDYASCLIYNKM